MPVTNYIWDDENDSLLMETDENGDTTAVYTNEPDQHGRVISQHRDGETSYYHYDALGSTHALTDASENITDTYLYTSFGDPVTATDSTPNSFRYVGEFGYYFDVAFGTYYVRRRVYQPIIGRWLSEDPAGYIDGPNRYSYVNNNPMNRVDPSGLFCGCSCTCLGVSVKTHGWQIITYGNKSVLSYVWTASASTTGSNGCYLIAKVSSDAIIRYSVDGGEELEYTPAGTAILAWDIRCPLGGVNIFDSLCGESSIDKNCKGKISLRDSPGFWIPKPAPKKKFCVSLIAKWHIYCAHSLFPTVWPWSPPVPTTDLSINRKACVYFNAAGKPTSIIDTADPGTVIVPNPQPITDIDEDTPPPLTL